jgi:tRNA A37 methylthiotransferase MiaB
VLVEGLSAKSVQDMTGHSTCQKVVNFPGSEALKGRIVRLIKEAKTNSLYGELANSSPMS